MNAVVVAVNKFAVNNFAVNNFGDTRSGGLAGPMGLLIIVLMSIAVVLLIRNMNKRLRRLPDSFPDQKTAERDAEITRLDAQASRTDSGEPHTGNDVDRSATVGGLTEPEVSDVDGREKRNAADGGA